MKKSIKNKKIIAAIGIVTVCTVLITAGVLKLVNKSSTESSAESLEKSKISNLFNIKQTDGDEEESSSGSSRVNYRTTQNSGNSTKDISATQQSTTSRTTTKQISSSKAPAKTQTNPSTPTTPVENPNPSTPTTPSQPQDNKTTTDNKPDEPTTPVNPTTPDTTSGYTITINNAIPGHTYRAYQIFQGDLYEPEEDGVITKKVLSNIKWGTSFESHGQSIINKLKEKYSLTGEYDSCTTAADVADVLSQHEEHANEFSIIVGDIINDPSNNISANSSNKLDKTYEITGLKEGYYIVIDAEIDNRDDAHSRYFLSVVSNVTMEVKSIVPYLEKMVSGGAKIDDTHNTATYYGKTDETYGLTFSLKATIPTSQSESNKDNANAYLAEYENYEYYIVDIIDKGFDLYKENGKVEVVAKDEAGNPLNIDFTVEDIVLTEDNKGEYKIEDITKYAGKTIFKITINNLKQQVNDESKNLNPGDVINFEYKARLNGSHNVGYNPNINEAYLIYSDNPHNSDSKSRTTENKTYTYSIDLELSKIAELKSQEDEKVSLPNATFELYKEDKKTKIAELTCSSEETAKGYAKYTSLSAGTYYIRETKAPDGYNKLKEDIKLTIESTLDSGTIKWNVTVEKTPEVNKLVHLYNEYNETTNSNGNGIKTEVKDGVNYSLIFIEVENTSGATLPVTGGIGTIVFTVIGLSIMIVAVVCLKSNKRK